MSPRSCPVRVAIALAAVLGCAGPPESPPTAQHAAEVRDSVEFVARGNEPFWGVTVSRDGVTWREPERPAAVARVFTGARPADTSNLPL